MRKISRSFNNIHFSKYSHPLYSTLLCKAEPCFHLINTKKKLSFIPLFRQLKFKCHVTMQWTIKLSTRDSSITAAYLHDNKNHHDCMFLSCHVRVSGESILYSCLNVKELLARSRHKIWGLSDCNWTRTQKPLVGKRTLDHLPKWLSVCVLVYKLSGSGFESRCSY